jgi:hypothetical protein
VRGGLVEDGGKRGERVEEDGETEAWYIERLMKACS